MIADNLGKLLLRLLLGGLLLFHGYAKITHGVSGIEDLVVARGFPAFSAWGVYVGEVVAPILIILGVYTRVAGLIVAFTLVVAIVLVHPTHLFQLSASGGWKLELQALYLFGGLALALLGAGSYSLARRNGRWN